MYIIFKSVELTGVDNQLMKKFIFIYLINLYKLYKYMNNFDEEPKIENPTMINKLGFL